MGLTPKETGVTAQAPVVVYPFDVQHSCLCATSSDNLSRTNSTAPTSLKKATIHCGLKPLAANMTNHYILSYEYSGWFEIRFTTDAKLQVYGNTVSLTSDMQFNDTTNHYHITVSVDTTLATESERVKVWVNGRRVSLTGTYPALNADSCVFLQNGATWHVMRRSATFAFLTGYLSNFHVIDGLALDASTFGELSDRVADLYVPKAPTVSSYGNNGLHMDFANGGSLGSDASGNDNHMTVAGSPTQTTDTPTNNQNTLNPLTPETGTYKSGNRGGTAVRNGVSTMLMRGGKWYAEVDVVSIGGGYPGIGVTTEAAYNAIAAFGGQKPDCYTMFPNGAIWKNNVNVATASFTFGAGSRVALAVDADSRQAWLGLISGGSITWDGDPVAGTGCKMPLDASSAYAVGLATPSSEAYLHTNPDEWLATNVPDGFLPLCAASLEDGDVLDTSKFADIVLRTGAGVELDVTSLAFRPDWLNIKNRTTAYGWRMCDVLRGPSNYLRTDSANGAFDEYDSITAFTETGYNINVNSVVNALGDSFLDLALKADPRAGLDIVTWYGNGVAGRQIAHNLNAVPAFILVKRLDVAAAWCVYHLALGKGYQLNMTVASAVATGNWGFTTPMSTYFTVGEGTNVNANGGQYVAYLFADSDVFKVFSYMGNGSTDGPLVNLDGRPLSIMFLKNSNASSDWLNYDAIREPVNSLNKVIYPNLSSVEGDVTAFNIQSNGFKVIGTGAAYNGSGNTMVGLAMMRQPFKYSNAF